MVMGPESPSPVEAAARAAPEAPQLCRILSLDGGGAKGFYTLGVLREIEGMIRRPLCERFDLIFGTSTGAIIAALLALGKTVKEISELYKKHVPTVMQKKGPHEKSAALAELGDPHLRGQKIRRDENGCRHRRDALGYRTTHDL
jgi:predicted acylesterase/phospholipase RssA